MVGPKKALQKCFLEIYKSLFFTYICLISLFFISSRAITIMEGQINSKPFTFKPKPRRQNSEQAKKYKLRQMVSRVEDSKKLKRILKLRRIHLQRAISVKLKGTKWWNKLMQNYYGEITEENMIQCKENTTSDIMLQYKEIRGEPKSYSDMFLFHQYSEFQEDNIVRFLFKQKTTNVINVDTGEDQVFSLLWFKCIVEEDENGEEISENTQIEDHQRQSISNFSVISINNVEEELQDRAKYEKMARPCYLKYIGRITCPNVLLNCLNYQEKLNFFNYNQLETQLSILPEKLQYTHDNNILLWDQATSNYHIFQERMAALENKCSKLDQLKTALNCRNRLLYFKKGFSDKTEDQLQDALQQLELEEKRISCARNVKEKRKLARYNDCRICFFPEVKPDNSIIFCHGCFTSFHNNCYGLQSSEQEQQFLCDACLWMEQRQIEYNEIDKKPYCEICYTMKQFPLKKIGRHFYHVTCLYFFNFIEVRSFRLALKEKVSKKIKKQSRVRTGSRCDYCLPDHQYLGIHLSCEECSSKFHPICAYLRGCFFSIDRSDQLSIVVRCSYHSYYGNQDEQLRQVYMRRFFCNYQKIQKMTEMSFKPIFRAEKMDIIKTIRLLKHKQTWEGYQEQRKINNRIPQKSFKPISLEQLLQNFTIHDPTNAPETEEIEAEEIREVPQYNYE